MEIQKEYSALHKLAAWSVHVFTSLGICAAFMAILAIARNSFEEAFWWLLLCQFIDGVDGTFARLFKVKQVLPYMNGTTIDNVIDFATYAIIPAYFFYEADLVTENLKLPLTFLILLVSALYYGKEGMISEDNYFIGFPVIWNVAVFFIFFVFDFSSGLNAIYIVVLAILHFVPIKYVYPSRASKQFWPTLLFTILLGISLVMILWYYPDKTFWSQLAILSAVYYGVMAIYNTWIEK